MADVSKLSDEQVDQVFEDCLNLENAFYKKGWDEGFAKVNKEAVRDGENYGKLYGFTTSSIIHYCKSILATLVRDAVLDEMDAITQAKKQAMRTLIIRIEKMEAEEAYDQTNLVSMVRRFNVLMERVGLPDMKILIPEENEDVSF